MIRNTLSRFYLETMPIVLSHVSTRCGHSVIGESVGRSANACPPRS